MKHQIYTINGKALLDYLRINSKEEKGRAIRFCEDFVLSSNEYEDSALFYQLRQVVRAQIDLEDEGALKRLFLYVDFDSAFPLSSRRDFDMLFKNGFSFNFGDGQAVRFLPFLSSQSQSKERIFAFIREDIFATINRRLNLDIDFEKHIHRKSLSYLTKLYAYRALYMSSATEVLRAQSELGDSFFTAENIIVLPDVKHNFNEDKDKVRVFTSRQEEQLSSGGEAIVRQYETETCVPIDCFDGEGIISPACAELINGRLKGDKKGSSFQIRMPFLKGVLHTVDFHAFLRDKGVEGESALVEDCFGVKRDLFKANVIIRPSTFKFSSLVKDIFDDKSKIMDYYFEKLREYNHGLYLVKTESSFHNTKYVRLSSQILSTLDLSVDELDRIVKEHLDMADAFRPHNLADPQKLAELSLIEDKESWMELLAKEPRFINDPHLQTALSNHRVSRYNDVAQGRILVEGENRFLSGDLLYFLIDLLKRIGDKSLGDELEKLRKNRIGRGGVYMPGVECRGQEVALIRSPHLSRNEDVCTVLCGSDDHKKYFENLRGVVFVGDRSYIPSALGGADFDGDQISIIYDKRVIKACRKSGYTEIGDRQSAVPFIHIESLKGESAIKRYKYVSSQAVYNTFSNRIGEISNAAMKLAAVEYDQSIPKSEGATKAAFCTILTGNEIDATKRGVRPCISEVVGFSGEKGSDSERVVKEIEKYIRTKKVLRSRKGKIPKVVSENGTLTATSGKDLKIECHSNRERNAVAQLLYRWAEAFAGFKDEKKQYLSKKAVKELEAIFGAGEQSEECLEIFSAFMSAISEQEDISKKQKAAQERISQNTAKIRVRLKGQYDDIYSETKVLSYADRFDKLQQDIAETASRFSLKEITELKDMLFSEKEKEFNPDSFWPYSKVSGNAKENRLFAAISSLENAELLLNFDYEGYRLLYYALDNVVASMAMDGELGESVNCYHQSYRELCHKLAKQDYPNEKIKKAVADSAVSDLCMSELGRRESREARRELIQKIYPLTDEKMLKAFWEMFGENQMISALGGEESAR